MALSQDERARIREEELIRQGARMEMKRKQAPRLILLAVLWFAVLTALAWMGTLLDHSLQKVLNSRFQGAQSPTQSICFCRSMVMPVQA